MPMNDLQKNLGKRNIFHVKLIIFYNICCIRQGKIFVLHVNNLFLSFSRNIMKICIETCFGVNQIYKIDVEPSITILQLKQMILEKTGDGKNPETMYFQFNGSRLEDIKTLADYDIKDESTLQLAKLNTRTPGFSSMGMKFADLSYDKGLKKQPWSKTGPRWRIASPGLCLEGICTNKQCDAHNQRVVIPVGYEKFDMLLDTNDNTTICPVCEQYVEPQTCGFNNCWWRYQGIKQDEIGKSPKKCSSDWQHADDAYHYFDQQISGMVMWKQLIVEAVKDKPQ